MIVRGLRCPYPDVQMTFKLQSATLGVSIQSIVIPVVRIPSTDSNEKHDLPQLSVVNKKIFANGRLTLAFNTEVKWPAFQTKTTDEPKDTRRVLLEEKVGLPISEFVSA